MTVMRSLNKLAIEGFKSIRSLDIELGQISVLIGPNGAGKSNFIDFFRMLNALVEGGLQLFVGKGGTASAFLHYGPKRTKAIEARMYFHPNAYGFVLEPTDDNALVFAQEVFHFKGSVGPIDRSLGQGHRESLAAEQLKGGPNRFIAEYIVPAIKSWKVYHFHDTSASAPVKQVGALNDNEFLRPDAGNLAAFLYVMRERHPEQYERIRHTVQVVVPAFDDFMLRPLPTDADKIRLEWREKNSDYPFLAHQLSDGTLRFMCLATLLLQPKLPATLLIDEPELGLHPAALTLLGDLIHEASRRAQVIISTQSIALVNEFGPDDIITVDREDGASVFHRHSEEELAYWLKEYSLGEIWEKNIIGGRP